MKLRYLLGTVFLLLALGTFFFTLMMVAWLIQLSQTATSVTVEPEGVTLLIALPTATVVLIWGAARLLRHEGRYDLNR